MLAFANAKINLGLHITARRADGYHQLETVFHPVRLYDIVEITDAAQTGFQSRGIAIPGELADNLCLRAFQLLKDEFRLAPQQITLFKNIPVGAGLGGGSSDAAFLLKLINSKFNLGLQTYQLEAYAARLGADCPFFIRNETVFAAGTGNEFSPVKTSLSGYHITLVKPDVHVSTAEAYSLVRPAKPDFSLLETLLLPVQEWQGKVKNDFEPFIFRKYPEIAHIKQTLYDSGATFALMSGSGSSVFGLFENEIRIPQLETANQVFYTKP